MWGDGIKKQNSYSAVRRGCREKGNGERGLATTGAATAATVQAFDDLALFELVRGNATDARAAEVVIARLDASQAAQSLVSRLLPFGDEGGIGVLLLEAPIVELARDLLLPVVHVEDVSTALVMQTEDGPHRFSLSLALMGIVLGVLHLLSQLIQRGLDKLPSLRRLLLRRSHLRHPFVFSSL